MVESLPSPEKLVHLTIKDHMSYVTFDVDYFRFRPRKKLYVFFVFHVHTFGPCNFLNHFTGVNVPLYNML